LSKEPPPFRTATPSGRLGGLFFGISGWISGGIPRGKNFPRTGVLDEESRTGGVISGMDTLTAFPSAAQTPRRGWLEAKDAVGATSDSGDHRRHVLSILSDCNRLMFRDFCHAPRLPGTVLALVLGRPGRSILGINFCARRPAFGRMKILF